MSNYDVTTVKLIERVCVVKTDLDHPEKPPEIVEQETVTSISLDEAALLGFLPGQGFRLRRPTNTDGHVTPAEDKNS
jgi:hypothetical protein